jgi:hypothetical protein
MLEHSNRVFLRVCVFSLSTVEGVIVTEDGAPLARRRAALVRWRSGGAGGRRAAAQLDHAARPYRVTGHKSLERGPWREHIEQPTRDAFVQRTDRRLVLAYDVAIGTVAQTDRQPITPPRLHDRSKAQRRQRLLHRLQAGSGLAGSKLAADLPTCPFESSETDRSLAHRPRQPTAQIPIRARRLSCGSSARGDHPRIRGTPTRALHTSTLNQTGTLETLQMDPHAIGMHIQPVCELRRFRCALQLGKKPE